jgi:hypothetical protein
MRRSVALAGIFAVAAVASASPDKAPSATKMVFFGPTEGPLAPTAEESFVGLKAAFAARAGADADVEIARDAPKKPKDYDRWFADLDARGVFLAFAYVADGETLALEKAAEKAKFPILVLSPEPTRPDLAPTGTVFWAGGRRPADEALAAMDFLLTPLCVRTPAVFHDGSARAVEAAAKCARLCHATQRPHAPLALPADFGVADVKGLLGRHASSKAGDGSTSAGTVTAGVDATADGIVYFGGPADAERLLSVCVQAKIDAPVLLGQGLVSRSVPSFAGAKATSAWGLEACWFEDYVDGKGSPAPADLPKLTEAAKATGDKLYAATIRGWRAARWIQEALRRAPECPEKKDKPEKKFLWAMHAIEREPARGHPVFEPWNHASLARLEPWSCGKYLDGEPCSRVKPLYLPAPGMPLPGFFDPSRFKYEPGSYYVWLHWGKPEERTIDKDAAGIGIGGYEQAAGEQIVADLMGRTISRLNRLYLREPDGTAIPGLSYNVTFGTEPHPEGLKTSRRYEMVLRGDSPDTGGVAHGMTSEVFTTYIQRTIYLKHALKPPISAADREYVNGTYKWWTSIERNMRSGEIRALVDGFTQAFALTGAHEAGHMFGLGHDQTTPRSIMNVAEAVGLDFEWAEWAPEHAVQLEAKLGRVPFPK